MATQQRVSTEDIIRQGTASNGENFNEIYQYIERGIQSGKVRVFRYNNTLLVYTIAEKGVAEVHLYSADQPPAMIDAFKNFYHAFKVCGFKKLYSLVENPQIVRMLQMAKIPVHVRQTHEGYQITAEVK